MKKRIGAALLGLSLIPINCFGAVNVLNDEYKTSVSTVTVTGTAQKGDSLGFSVTANGANAADAANIKATGDVIVENDDGTFEIAFTMPDNATTGDYTLRIGWFGGDEIKTKDIRFVNVLSTAEAIKNATTLEKLEEIFAKDSKEKEALIQLGYDFDGLNETISDDGKTKILTAFLNDENRKSNNPATASGSFDKHLGLEFINEKKDGGLERINPKFKDDKNYGELTDSALKKYLNDGIYANAPYANLDDLNAAYTELNIIYEFNNAAVGEFGGLVEKYRSEMGIENKVYYKTYASMSSTQKNKVASLYIGYADKEIVTGFDKFGELFKKAVDETEKSVSNDSTSNRGSGGGGGGFKGGETSVKEKPDATNSDNTENDDNGVFADISNVSWAKDAILSLAQKGIINGTAPKTFEPNSNVTREQIVKMILLSMGESAEKGECPFGDVNDSEWYAPFVTKGYKIGIINGISTEEFGVGANLTRQDLAVIAIRAAKAANVEIPSDIKAANFNDADAIADYAKDAVNALYSMGIINGKDGNVFAPNDYCTRAEAAKITYNLFFKQEANA